MAPDVFSGLINRKKTAAVSRTMLLLVLLIRDTKALRQVAVPGEMGRKQPLVSVQTWRDSCLEDTVILAAAPLHPLLFPERESPSIDPKETFTPQFLPAGFYSHRNLQPSLTLSCSPALRRKAS